MLTKSAIIGQNNAKYVIVYLSIKRSHLKNTQKIAIEEIDNITQKVKDIIEENGTVTKVEKMGMKKLADEIRKNKEGYYIVIYFEADASIISKLERYYRITENIIKFLIVRKDD